MGRGKGGVLLCDYSVSIMMGRMGWTADLERKKGKDGNASWLLRLKE